MAEWMKADGTKETVKPKARYFTNDELRGLVDGFLTEHTLTRVSAACSCIWTMRV